MKCIGMKIFDYIKYRSTTTILREMRATCSSGEKLTKGKRKRKLLLTKKTKVSLS